MPKGVFFSFDFIEDLWRASIVRNRWIFNPSEAAGGFWDAEFTDGIQPSPQAIEAFIDEQLAATAVTVVLIGFRTATRGHVEYAIRRSAELGHGMLGIYIHQCRNRYGSPSLPGRNPFELVSINQLDPAASGALQLRRRGHGRVESLADLVPTYDWVADDGFTHMSEWIAEAMARAAARG